MRRTHLLDTSVFSQPLKKKPLPSVLRRWKAVGDESICTSAVCQAELLQGLAIRDSRNMWAEYRHLLENHYPVLPFDQQTAHVFSEISATLRAAGKPRPVVDLLIAATARQHGLILATLNERHLVGIDGLVVENWSSDS